MPRRRLSPRHRPHHGWRYGLASVLLPMLFALYFYTGRNMSMKALFCWLAAQGVIFLTIKGALTVLFADTPGSPVAFHLGRDIGWLFQDYSVATFVVLAILFLLIIGGWYEKPRFARWALSMMVPLLALGFFLGYFDEIRGYFEVFPVFAILMGHSVARHMGMKLRVHEAQT